VVGSCYGEGRQLKSDVGDGRCFLPSKLLLTSMAVGGKGDRHDGADHGHADHAVEFILGKTVPFALIGFAEVGLVR